MGLLEEFQYHLERELGLLQQDLFTGRYIHGGYQTFIVRDPKKRSIAVATIRDRVVHRVLYEFLVPIFEPTFVFDVWSCRRGKGLQGAIDRISDLRRRFPKSWVLRADVHKFFDHVHHDILRSCLWKRVQDSNGQALLAEVICSYETGASDRGIRGIPIGNLTSQLFANVYLHELDYFVRHHIRPLGYVRYGDDFLLFMESEEAGRAARSEVEKFLRETLALQLHEKRRTLLAPWMPLRFLGIEFFPQGKRLLATNRRRIIKRIGVHNVGSYLGLAHAQDPRWSKRLVWLLEGNGKVTWILGE